MSELDPVTFLIATELLAGSNANASHRCTIPIHSHAASSSTLILLADGSDNEVGGNSFEDLSQRAQRDFGPDSVRIAYLQSDSPSLPDVVEDLLSRRIHRMRILPLFLSGAELVADNIVQEIRTLQERYAALEIELLPAIGEDTRFQRLLWQMVRENVIPEWRAKTS
jgi:sirohydrochlorin cobaltochelatase